MGKSKLKFPSLAKEDTRKKKIKDISIAQKCYRCQTDFPESGYRYYRIRMYQGYPIAGDHLCENCKDKMDYTIATDLFPTPTAKELGEDEKEKDD